MDKKLLYREARRMGLVMLGAAMYAVGVNLFVTPAGFFNGGVLGLCQLFKVVLVDWTHLLPDTFDLTGILYYLMNAPLLIIAWRRVDRRFVFRTVVSVTTMSLLMSLIPVKSLLGTDAITSCLVGGVIAGSGTGILLRAGATGGGMDIVGVIISQKKHDFSVGRVNLAFNIVLYFLFLVLFDAKTAIYSAIYSAVYSIALDRLHYQNINDEIIVLTKAPIEGLKQEIFNTIGRGVTTLNASGGYTGEPVTMLYIIASKYETMQLRTIIHKYDPHAFVTVKEHANVYGNFERRI